MIRVRNDDVLMWGTPVYWKDPFARFKEVHEAIQRVDYTTAVKYHRVLHVPAILTTEIQEFPECIEYIGECTEKGEMRPQLHGERHIDYGSLSYEEILESLKRAKGWMENNLGVTPTIWYTPWGAGEAPGQEYMWKAAGKAGLRIITCSDVTKLRGRNGLYQKLAVEKKNPLEYLVGKEIFTHWYENDGRLEQVLAALKAGKWEE